MEIAAVAATLLPSYEGRITYVDALTSDARAASVLDRYTAQYVPTSIFVGADGSVADTYVGPLDEAQLRERLNSLLDGD